MIFSLLTTLTVSLQMIHLYYYGKGNTRVAYRYGVVVYFLFIIVETCLAFMASQPSVLLFNIVNTWGLINAIKGAIRENSFGHKKGQTQHGTKSNQEER